MARRLSQDDALSHRPGRPKSVLLRLGAGGQCDTPLSTRITVVAVFLGLGAPLAAGPFEDAAIAAKTGDYATAMRLWLPLAEQGLVSAQLSLAIMYDTGQGLSRNDVAAASWYRKAADQGSVKAQSNLGFMYLNGRGVRQDFAEAVK
jgi:hypothetical protein